MTKRQRIRHEIERAIAKDALGAARTASLDAIRRKYSPGILSTEYLRAVSRFHPNNNYEV